MPAAYEMSVWIKVFSTHGFLPACHAGSCHGYTKNFRKNNNAQINDRVSRAMAGRSHEPYFFSTRWNTNGPNNSIVPLFQM
jgi:hypothetical protein